MQVEAHPGGADNLHVAHAVLQNLADLGPLEAELHIIGGERVAVVELDALAQLELVDALIGAHRPRLGQARRQQVARHRLHERVVKSVRDPEGGESAELSRVVPDGRQRHVERKAHLALGLLLGRQVWSDAANQQQAHHGHHEPPTSP